MHITEQWILSHAPGPALAESGRELSGAGSFSALRRTADGMTFWAECAGSAHNPYYVSVDFALSADEPVFSCSCPSRQTPCKHALGLLYELLADRKFTVDEEPAYVERARAKRAAEQERAAARLERARRQNAASREKRLSRQLEGLDKAEKFSNDLVRGGLSAASELPAQSLDRLAAEMGSCDLPGARDAFERMALLDRRLRQGELSERACAPELLRTLAALRIMILRARVFLERQLASGGYALEEPVLYEMLGGEWNADELRAIGACRKNARFVQLSFDVSGGDGRRARAERGFWMDLTRGELVHTLSTRPARMPKGEGMDDSCFSLLEIPLVYEAPVLPCPCVWWEDAAARTLSGDDLAVLRGFAATSIQKTVRASAEKLSEPLLPGYAPVLMRVGAVGYVGRTLVLEDAEGGRVALRDRPSDGAEHASVCRLTALPHPPEKGDAIFGLLFYDESDRRYCIHPYSVVRADGVVRLQF